MVTIREMCSNLSKLGSTSLTLKIICNGGANFVALLNKFIRLSQQFTLICQRAVALTFRFEFKSAISDVLFDCSILISYTMNYTDQILLFLFVINLGVSFGAGLYETRIVLPLWFPKTASLGYQVNAEAMQTIDTGRRFWAFVTTIPLTLLTIANLILAWQSDHPAHNWWLTSAFIVLVERLSTFTFFIPTVIKLQKASQLSASQVARSVSLWIKLNYVRNALILVAWLLSMRAFMTL